MNRICFEMCCLFVCNRAHVGDEDRHEDNSSVVLNRCFKSMGGGTRGESMGLGRNVGSGCKFKHDTKYGGASPPCPLKDHKQYGNGNLN